MINDIAGVGYILSKELIRRKYKVELLAKKNKLNSYPIWVDIYNNKLDEFLLKNIDFNKFDIIHLHYLTNWASLGLSFRKTKKPTVLHAHGSDTRPKNMFTKIVQKLVINKSNVLLYSTPDLNKNLKWFKGQLIYLPNPVEVPKKNPKVKKYENRILIFTTLNKVKKIEKIFPIIKNLDYKFDIIDFGPDKEYYKNITPKNVNFIKPIKHENIKKELLKYPLIIGGSQDGTIRMSELETMSLGIPTLFHFKYDYFYPESLPMSKLTVNNIKKYFGNYKLGQKQRKWVKKYHDVRTVTKQLLKIYKNTT